LGIQLLGLAARGQELLQFVGLIEMVFDGGFSASRDENEFLDAGGLRLFHGILDQRLVDDRQHFLRHRLGGRQKAGTEATDGEHSFADRTNHATGTFLLFDMGDSGPGHCAVLRRRPGLVQLGRSAPT
jgi:hypothetical protein